MSDYNSFAQNCVEELKELQAKLYKKYNLNGYENWFYDQATGLLTFSSENVELNFKYFQAGSFSNKSNTWKWSWDNDNTLEKAKGITGLVREFGEQSNFDKLNKGYFESDEIEAWELAAIAAKLADGIGVYRPIIDNHLQLFLILTEFVDIETAQKIKDKYISCKVHGSGRIAFVCKHLDKEHKVGFEEAFETYENMELDEEDDLQAWCDECETVRQGEDGWNDVSMAFARIKLVCEKCYFEMKELNL